MPGVWANASPPRSPGVSPWMLRTATGTARWYEETALEQLGDGAWYVRCVPMPRGANTVGMELGAADGAGGWTPLEREQLDRVREPLEWGKPVGVALSFGPPGAFTGRVRVAREAW